MHVASRAPTVFVVGIVLLTTVLLVAGFGVQIGIGVIVGALLGVAWIGALLAMNPRTGGGAGYVSWSGAGSSARPPGHEVIERYHRDWIRVAADDASELRRVIAVGRSVQAADVRAELVAVEIREDGGVAGIVTHTRGRRPWHGVRGGGPGVRWRRDRGEPLRHPVLAGTALGRQRPDPPRRLVHGPVPRPSRAAHGTLGVRDSALSCDA
ncbi:MAG: hypothetical protein HY262_13755 [Chloroflexi bacterium]|nr:hypothetical protein [Chloroflexota bacterium]